MLHPDIFIGGRMVTKSIITGKIYDPDKVWYIMNNDQIDFYNKHGAESVVLDVLYNSRKGKFIFVYPKNDFMKLLYQQWCDYGSK